MAQGLTDLRCAALYIRTHLSSFGSTKGRQFAKTTIEKKETVWATLRYACEDGETAVSTPMRMSLRANSKSSNLNKDSCSASRLNSIANEFKNYGALAQRVDVPMPCMRMCERYGLAYLDAVPNGATKQPIAVECTLPPKFNFVGADEALEARQSEPLLGIVRLFIPCNERKSDHFRVEQHLHARS